MKSDLEIKTEKLMEVFHFICVTLLITVLLSLFIGLLFAVYKDFLQ